MIYQNNYVLGCPTTTTTIKVHGIVHQTHVTAHQTLPKRFMKVHETVHQTNGTVHQTLPKIFINVSNNHP